MNLSDALSEIADFLALDADKLHAYASEDHLGGYHTDKSQERFPSGSLWGVEGQVIYALVRALRPYNILELGVHHGASTSHLALAVDTDDIGWLVSVDKWEGAGSLIPHDLQSVPELIFAEANAYIPTLQDDSIDFVFEDCIHSEEEVYAIVTALKPKLRKGAVVVHHDSEHGDDGLKIKRGVEAAGVHDYLSVLIEPSDCGLLFWRNG